MNNWRIRWVLYGLLSCVTCATGADDLAAGKKAAKVVFHQSEAAVDVYDFVEVTIDVAGPAVANPFTDVTVAGEFGCGDGEPVRADGFCDSQDGGVFRIRFMPIGRRRLIVGYVTRWATIHPPTSAARRWTWTATAGWMSLPAARGIATPASRPRNRWSGLYSTHN